MSAPGGLRSGELAGAASVNVQTLRYYERRGLISDPVRSPGGHRLYPPQTLTRLRVIKAAQRLGFTLEEIAELLEPRCRRPDHRFPDRARNKLAEVGHRIAELISVQESLTAALAAGCDDLQACAASDGCPIPFAPRPVESSAHG